jgi:hypothetical protein
MESFKESQRRGPGLSNVERRKVRKRCLAKLFSNLRRSFRLVMTPSGVRFLSIRKRKGPPNLTLTVKRKS